MGKQPQKLVIEILNGRGNSLPFNIKTMQKLQTAVSSVLPDVGQKKGNSGLAGMQVKLVIYDGFGNPMPTTKKIVVIKRRKKKVINK